MLIHWLKEGGNVGIHGMSTYLFLYLLIYIFHRCYEQYEKSKACINRMDNCLSQLIVLQITLIHSLHMQCRATSEKVRFSMALLLEVSSTHQQAAPGHIASCKAILKEFAESLRTISLFSNTACLEYSDSLPHQH